MIKCSCFFHFMFTYLCIFFCYMVCVWCSLGVTIYCAADICAWGLLHVFWQGLMFFLGTWIGSNDLIMGSACVTDKIYETRAWQQWGKVRKGMKQDNGNNEPFILGNETLSKHAFCLWKLSEGILQSIIDFWSFLSLPSRSWTTLVSLMSCCTLAQLSLTGASEIAFGNAEDEVTTAGVEEALLPLPQPPLPPQLAPVPNWLQGLLDMNWLTCELSSLVRLAWPPCKTMAGHNGCGYCLDMIVTIFLIDITSSFCIIQSLLVSLDFVHNLSQPSNLRFVANLRVLLENFEHWVFPGANTDSPLVFKRILGALFFIELLKIFWHLATFDHSGTFPYLGVASMLIISNCCILLFRLLIFSFCMVIRNWLIPGLLPSCCHLLDSLRFGLGFRLQLHQVFSGFSSLCSWLLPFELSLAKK